MRRLGELDLEPLAPPRSAAPWIGVLKLCARQDLTLETLELKVVQEEVIVRTGRAVETPALNRGFWVNGWSIVGISCTSRRAVGVAAARGDGPQHLARLVAGRRAKRHLRGPSPLGASSLDPTGWTGARPKLGARAETVERV